MRRREFIGLVGCVAAGWPLAAWAQKMPVSIGFLAAGAAGSANSSAYVDAIKQGLRDNGLVESRDYVLEARFAAGNYSTFPELAGELAARGARVAFVARSAPNTVPPKASRCSMIYTSGTTGRPKGVKRTPSTPEQQARGAAEIGKHWGLVDDPSIVVMMNGPMYHSAPAAYGRQGARLGLNIVLQARFEAEDMLRLIHKHRVSHMHIVPTMFVRLLRLPADVKAKYDLASLRWITHGAAPCAPSSAAGSARRSAAGFPRRW